jgi:hypothetical protein
MRVDILAIMKFRPFLAILALVLPIWAQTVDLSGSWVLVKTEDKISAPNSGAAPPVPGGGTAPGHNPGGQSRTGGYPAGGGSQPVPELAMPDLEGLELIILQSADEIRIERRWQVLDKTRSIRQVYPLDGKEIVNEAPDGSAILSRSRWNGSTLIHEGTQRSSLGSRRVDLRVREEYSVSRDGKTLTAKIRRSTPYGQSETTQVFRKEQDAAK